MRGAPEIISTSTLSVQTLHLRDLNFFLAIKAGGADKGKTVDYLLPAY